MQENTQKYQAVSEWRSYAVHIWRHSEETSLCGLGWSITERVTADPNYYPADLLCQCCLEIFTSPIR